MRLQRQANNRLDINWEQQHGGSYVIIQSFSKLLLNREKSRLNIE